MCVGAELAQDRTVVMTRASVLRCLFNDAVSVLDSAALTGRDSG